MRIIVIFALGLLGLQPAVAQSTITSHLTTTLLSPHAGMMAESMDSISVPVPEIVDRWHPATTWRTVETASDVPHWNLRPYGTGTPAGDVNGDGRDDLLFSAWVADERTEDPGDWTGKTLVFYGGNFTATPDQVVYAKLEPVGDMNGDGYADAIADASPVIGSEELNTFYVGSSDGFQATGASTPLSVGAKTIAEVDMDGDGMDDVVSVSFTGYDVYWGDADLEQVATSSKEVMGRVWYEAGGDIDGDGRDELVLVHDAAETQGYAVDVIGFSAGREPEVIETDVVSRPQAPHVLDVDGDAIRDLLTEYAGEGTLFFGTGGGAADGLLEPPVTVSVPHKLFQPIGDVDGDGKEDVLAQYQSAPGPALWYGPLVSDRDNVNALSPDAREAAYGEEYDAENERFGDINGDGLSDIVLEVSIDSSFGRHLLLSNGTRELQHTDVLYDRSDYVVELVRYTHALGDLNDDGIDDFAFVHLGDDDRVAVYFGGEELPQEPPVVLRGSEGIMPKMVKSGNFNGDGHHDLAVAYSRQEMGIGLYFGPLENNVAPDLSIPYGSAVLENAGDVNGDGIDDLMYATPSLRNGEVYLTYGSASMTLGPDTVISYPNNQYTGANVVRLGDVNGDGLDDVAVGDHLSRSDGGIGVCYVHFGRADGSAWGEPDLVLKPAPGTSIFPLGVDGADVNGDGVRDIVAKPYTVMDPADSTGVQQLSIEVYFGGEDIDNVPDRRIPIPAAALGYADPDAFDGNVGELTRVPDVDGDGDDEVLVSSVNVNNGESHAVLVLGGAGTHEAVQLVAPNPHTGLGTDNNNLWLNTSSAVGDFDGDGQVDLLLPQEKDHNDAWRSSRIYRYTPAATGSAVTAGAEPTSFRLLPSYPNPARRHVTVPYVLERPEDVTLRVYDLVGREVQVLHLGSQAAGTHRAEVDVRALSSGVYVYRLEAGPHRSARMMAVVR